MELKLKRTIKDARFTMGDLYVDGVFECYTLEDAVRDIAADGAGKIFGETAIPAGRYKVIYTLSPRFKRNMMRLLDVPHFTGILIHGGNSIDNTEGCILVGDKVSPGAILPGSSTPAVKRLEEKVVKALQAGDVWITIE